MNSHTTRHACCALLLLALFSSLAADRRAFAQKREHLTPEEIEQVRDAQELDKRTAVFIKAAERRLLALTDPAAAAKQSEKETEKWGTVKGTRTQLLTDLSRILEEATLNIDDAAQRNPQSPLLIKSLRKLSEAVARFLPQVTPLRDAATDERERETVEEVIEHAQEILDAARQHPAEDGGAKEKTAKKKGQ